MKTDPLLEKYRNELTKRSIMFYENNSIANHKKVQERKEFLKGLLDRLEDDKYNIFDCNGYNELHGIIERASINTKVNKNSIFKNFAVNLYGKLGRK